MCHEGYHSLIRLRSRAEMGSMNSQASAGVRASGVATLASCELL